MQQAALIKICRCYSSRAHHHVSQTMLRRNAATGPDGIFACLYSWCQPTGSSPASHPSSDESLALNYRPISLLSLCSKLPERLVHNNLIKHVIYHKLLSDFQFGFHQMSSTQDAILSASHDWHKTLEEHGSVV